MSDESLRELALQKAKITPEELGQATREAFDENRRLLTATRKEVKVVDGTPVEYDHPDNPARLRAIESMYDLAGVRAPTRGTGGSGPTFVLNLPGYYDPKFIAKEQHVDADYTEVEDARTTQ